jgi:hypothetical protein
VQERAAFLAIMLQASTAERRRTPTMDPYFGNSVEGRWLARR